jgi:hypothetical protein
VPVVEAVLPTNSAYTQSAREQGNILFCEFDLGEYQKAGQILITCLL